MTNEQLAILLMQLRTRIGMEIDSLEQVLIEVGMTQYQDRSHSASDDSTCNYAYNLGFFGHGPCVNEDHYTSTPNGTVVCLDDLRAIVLDLDEQIALLRPQAEQTEV